MGKPAEGELGVVGNFDSVAAVSSLVALALVAFHMRPTSLPKSEPSISL
jgi:hypothetical protein